MSLAKEDGWTHKLISEVQKPHVWEHQTDSRWSWAEKVVL